MTLAQTSVSEHHTDDRQATDETDWPRRIQHHSSRITAASTDADRLGHSIAPRAAPSPQEANVGPQAGPHVGWIFGAARCR